jgi:hypothetical protein
MSQYGATGFSGRSRPEIEDVEDISRPCQSELLLAECMSKLIIDQRGFNELCERLLAISCPPLAFAELLEDIANAYLDTSEAISQMHQRARILR